MIKRLLFALLAAFGVIAVVLLVSLWQFRWIAETLLTRELGVPVKIENVSYSKHTISIDNVIIGNPVGSRLSFALKIGKITIEAPPVEYFHKTITFDRFLFDNIEMNIEFYDKAHSQGNWNTILNNLKRPSVESRGSSRNAFIKLLVFNNLTFKLLQYDALKPTVLPPLQTLKFENIQTANGELTNEIAEAILNYIVQAVFWKYTIKSTLDFPFQVSNNALGGAFNTLKSLFGGS